MGRRANNQSEQKWRHLQVLVKPQNQAIIHLLSDGKPRMPVEICRELKRFPKATLYLAMKDLANQKILTPMIIENKTKPWRTLTELLGYTLNKDVYKLIKILDEAEEQAKKINK